MATIVSVVVSNGRIVIKGDNGVRGVVQLVLYDPQTHDVAIVRGENTGRKLPHRNIVKELTVLGWWEGGELEFPLPEIDLRGLSAAIIVQKGRGGPVIGAARV